jgi:spermidine/putrescine transport system substrate-binding protein
MSRRSLLKGAGTGATALGLGAILAACGGNGGGGTGGGGGGSSSSMDASQIFSGQAGDTVEFANWPLYLDQAKDKNGDVYHPSLREFAKETGITVDYQDVIQDNAEFFGKLRPQLESGDPTGWDIIVITNGTEFTALTQNNWVYPLDASKHPNFDANAEPWAKNPSYDPNNEHSMAWQSGVTGIGVNKDLVKAPVTKMDDLANPDIVGTGSVGMLKSDMPDVVMINLGIDPKTSGPDEWKEAANWLVKQRDSGTVRQYYTQGYIDDLTGGNLSATMAWSGDVLYNALWAGYDNLDFVFPANGALLWDRQHAGPGRCGEPGRRDGGHGLLLQARDRHDGHRVGVVHVAGAGREGPDPQGRAESRGPELQGLREQAVRHGQEPVSVPGRGVPLEDVVRPAAQDRRRGL